MTEPDAAGYRALEVLGPPSPPDDGGPVRARRPDGVGTGEPPPGESRTAEAPPADGLDAAAPGGAGLAEDTLVDAGEQAPLVTLDADELEAALEALLLVVDAPTEEEVLASALGEPVARVRFAVARLAEKYTAQRRGIDLRRTGGGWRFYTRDIHAPYVERLLLDGQRARLTRAALETLAVVAYRQPVTRARVAAVRGVNCDGVLRTLVTRGLVCEVGIEVSTQGTLFATTELFLERLGLESLVDLPPLAPLLPDVDAIDEL